MAIIIEYTGTMLTKGDKNLLVNAYFCISKYFYHLNTLMVTIQQSSPNLLMQWHLAQYCQQIWSGAGYWSVAAAAGFQ